MGAALEKHPDEPARSIGDILSEALAHYQGHLAAFLLTAAVFLVPAGLVSGFLLPLSLRLLGFLPPFATLLLGVAVTSVVTGVVTLLAVGALTIASADRILGGDTPWLDHARLALTRLPSLLSAILPVVLISLVLSAPMVVLPSLGLLMAVPQVLLYFFFAFVPVVVVVENLRGVEALARSFSLVKADWSRVALVFLVYVAVAFVAGIAGSVFLGLGLWPITRLIQAALPIAVLPFTVLAGFLLYLDVRRQHEGLDPETLRQELEATRN